MLLTLRLPGGFARGDLAHPFRVVGEPEGGPQMPEPDPGGIGRGVLFGGVFSRGGVDAGDEAWLQAMLDTEAALARAVERAGLAPKGSGTAVTEAARAGNFDAAAIGQAGAAIGNPVQALVRSLTEALPEEPPG